MPAKGEHPQTLFSSDKHLGAQASSARRRGAKPAARSEHGKGIESVWLNQTQFGGARRDRTDDLLLAKQALSQLSYGPDPGTHQPQLAAAAGTGGPGPSGKAGQPEPAQIHQDRRDWWA